MKNTFAIYEGSYQADRIETEKNITKEFAEFQLAKYYEYRKSNEYWCSIKIGNIETRYRLKNGYGELEVIKVIDWNELKRRQEIEESEKMKRIISKYPF